LRQLPYALSSDAGTRGDSASQSAAPQKARTRNGLSKRRLSEAGPDRVSAGRGDDGGADMTSAQAIGIAGWNLMGQAEPPPAVVFDETEKELWLYRRRTVALLRRYARASVEVGRLPSLLGREFFRTRVTSYTMRNFEKVVIFVADMERAIERLNGLEKKLLAMNILEDTTVREMTFSFLVVD